jgi:hypothetical protein
MQFIGISVIALGLLLPLVPAHAAETGAIIRAGELKAKPFIDAATMDKLAANQPVTILSRQGGWVQVESNGKTGWVRMLNIRMQSATGSGPAAKPKSSGLASLLHTGSSGKTVTTGVKGLGEENIRNATPDPVQVAALARLAVPAAEATANARQSGLQESQIAYLKIKKGSGK